MFRGQAFWLELKVVQLASLVLMPGLDWGRQLASQGHQPTDGLSWDFTTTIIPWASSLVNPLSPLHIPILSFHLSGNSDTHPIGFLN
jgi:hypothetical protein